jgi:hypothetical protein
MKANPKGGNREIDDTVSFLDQTIKKLLMMKHSWDIYFRILPPTSPDRPFGVTLEKGSLTEQFFLSQREVLRSQARRNDVTLLTETRAAVLRLEKRVGRRAFLQS